MSENKKVAPVDAKIRCSIKATQPDDSEKFKIPDLPYKGTANTFGVMTKKEDKVTAINWEGCRDRFQNTSEPAEFFDFLFCCKPGSANNVIDFVHTVEELLKLPTENRLVIKRTTTPELVYVRMSPWWKYKLRRSLLTALLKCGQEYSERTTKQFKKALYSQYYLRQTQVAVEQFLFKRRTASKLKRKFGFGGWHNQFIGRKEDDVRKVLTRLKPPLPASEQTGEGSAGEMKPVEPVKQE